MVVALLLIAVLFSVIRVLREGFINGVSRNTIITNGNRLFYFDLYCSIFVGDSFSPLMTCHSVTHRQAALDTRSEVIACKLKFESDGC